MFFSINFGPVQYAVEDPGIKPETAWDPKTNTRVMPTVDRGFGHIDAEALLDAGYGVATYYYGDVDPDYAEGFPNGIRARYLKPGQKDRSPDDWGSIAAWAWGMSRVEDYFETDKSIDAKRVVIHGVSRLGKTVMWAGAHDQRFAAVIASCSGEGGAALSHRNYGETIAHLTAPSRYPYQFAINYAKYAGFPDKAPMDANLLIALIAPRPLLLQTGNTDYWSDPKGEFLAEVAAGPVYKLLGKQDLGTDAWPAAKEPIFHDLGYYMHDGGHGWCLRIGASISTSSRRRYHRLANVHLGEDCPRGFGWIAGLGDRASHDEIIGSGGERSSGSGDALLVSDGCAGGADAGRDQDGSGSAERRGGRPLRGCRQSRQSHSRKPFLPTGAPVRRDCEGADGGQLGLIHAGEDGDGEQLWRIGEAGGGFGGGGEHGWASAGVNGEQFGAKRANRAHRGGDGVGDVVEFQIEKDGVAALRAGFRRSNRQPRGRAQGRP